MQQTPQRPFVQQQPLIQQHQMLIQQQHLLIQYQNQLMQQQPLVQQQQQQQQQQQPQQPQQHQQQPLIQMTFQQYQHIVTNYNAQQNLLLLQKQRLDELEASRASQSIQQHHDHNNHRQQQQQPLSPPKEIESIYLNYRNKLTTREENAFVEFQTKKLTISRSEFSSHDYWLVVFWNKIDDHLIQGLGRHHFVVSMADGNTPVHISDTELMMPPRRELVFGNDLKALVRTVDKYKHTNNIFSLVATRLHKDQISALSLTEVKHGWDEELKESVITVGQKRKRPVRNDDDNDDGDDNLNNESTASPDSVDNLMGSESNHFAIICRLNTWKMLNHEIIDLEYKQHVASLQLWDPHQGENKYVKQDIFNIQDAFRPLQKESDRIMALQREIIFEKQCDFYRNHVNQNSVESLLVKMTSLLFNKNGTLFHELNFLIPPICRQRLAVRGDWMDDFVFVELFRPDFSNSRIKKSSAIVNSCWNALSTFMTQNHLSKADHWYAASRRPISDGRAAGAVRYENNCFTFTLYLPTYFSCLHKAAKELAKDNIVHLSEDVIDCISSFCDENMISK